MNAASPLVSCIMPTCNRRMFVGQAIWYFLRQDYPAKELIVVDDGEDAIADLIPPSDLIRYVRLPQRSPLGSKRNLACEHSQGELIAHWDDDDWIAPNRLSIQVAQLLAADADVCGLSDLLYYRVEAGEAWRYCYSAQTKPWVAGCTLLYRRAAWAAHRFPDVSVGEDTAFIWKVLPERIHAIAESSFYVALIHSRNTATKNLADQCWQKWDLNEISNRIAPDREFYLSLRHQRPVRLSKTLPVQLTVTVAAPFNVAAGYGSMAEYLVLSMIHSGAMVNVVPFDLDLRGMTAEFQAVVQSSHRYRTQISHTQTGSSPAPILYFFWPRAELEQFKDNPNLFINTMWESSGLPKGWAEPLNQARVLIVPTRFLAQSCREGGVTVPVEVIPEGIDPSIYHYLERPDRPLTTLIVGPIADRKHTLEGIAAWKLAFTGDPDARLIIKTNYNYKNYVPDDPRIQYVDTHETTRGIAHWYQQADVLLALGNEGFGLPLVEGMATGLPVIALDSEGQADMCADAPGCLLPIKPVHWQSLDPSHPSRDIRGVPGVEEVAERLSWVANHREEARAIGRAAAAWVPLHRNIWSKGPAVLDVMERYVQPARSLRRFNTVWVPSWGSSCGVAEYTKHLVSGLPGVQISIDPPDADRARVIHLQHEHSLFNDVALTQYMQTVAQSGVPTVITEHTVSPYMQPWERDASVLAALTQRGVDMLRQRWINKRVELLPMGCPTWFPPRKSSRGRVIGVFGFLGIHKGFWQLLDVLRSLPDTQLLMFSHARYAEIETSWINDAQGLPVHRIKEFLPVEEIAHRLAAEADILVFWYDEIIHASASYAVRIGLATGVPVLTSPTSWFHDLRQCTYQPQTLLDGVQQLLDDTSLQEQLATAARTYCYKHNWLRVAKQHLDLWQTLHSQFA